MTRGFTLVETMFVLAISTVMLMTLGLLINAFNKNAAYGQALAASSGSASALLREIESLALPADAVLDAHTFSGTTYDTSPTVVVLELPSIDDTGNIVADAHDYAAFYTVGTSAYRLLEASALSARVSGTKQLSATVQELSFSYNHAIYAEASVVTVDLRTEAHTQGATLTDHRSERIRLRNR